MQSCEQNVQGNLAKRTYECIEFPAERLKQYPSILTVSRGVIDMTPKSEQRKELRRRAEMSKKVVGTVISEHIPLKEWDDSGETYVVFQRPKRWEEEVLDKMQAASELVWSTAEQGTVRQRDRTPLSVIESEMVAMCLVESNLAKAEEDGGAVLFVPGKSCRETRKSLSDKAKDGFYASWRELDGEIADEIVNLLREWHPPFDWRAPGRGEA